MTHLVGYFRRRAIAAGVVAGGLAIGAIPVLAVDAPVLADELTARGWPLVVASGMLGATALALLWRDRPRGTRACAVGRGHGGASPAGASPSTRTSCRRR